MKRSNIQHKDVRYYNNLLLGRTRMPKGGNYQGAGNEHLKSVDKIKLEERADGLWIRIPLVPATRKRAIVTTELLGKATIPGAPFENPDGTPYRLDTDYFGKKRNPENPAAGPFATQGDKEIHLRVWPKE